MSKPRSAKAWIQQALQEETPRSKSLLITIFGDSISPYSSGIWLSDLIALVAPFGVNERLVRTSGFRLAEEGWLQSNRHGRTSRYALTPSGSERVKHAYHRIYDLPPRKWNGEWTMVVLSKSDAPAAQRAELRQELQWEGFGILSTGVFVHPRADLVALAEILTRLRLNIKAIVLQARDSALIPPPASSRIANECWELNTVASRYRAFLDRFQPALPFVRERLDPQTAFVVQTLLLHSFRRVVLHDPRLPPDLLPRDWPGHRAYDLCRSIYLRTWKPTADHLARHLEPRRGAALTPTREFKKRLGGLGL